jgi:hypothetical protein
MNVILRHSEYQMQVYIYEHGKMRKGYGEGITISNYQRKIMLYCYSHK